ncbi:hypothetical protein VHP8226_03213 [Vibrio hippocampi]|uniref:Uncharacterized protein n=1 Tax=Vibrio hippocampi TaxID=654686 RepID=A0ABN8DJF2_9VIBR|nr:hypothetical protein VHP8226_03213 [Vibrio hippocampi]
MAILKVWKRTQSQKFRLPNELGVHTCRSVMFRGVLAGCDVTWKCAIAS